MWSNSVHVGFIIGIQDYWEANNLARNQKEPSPPLDMRGRVLRKWHHKVEHQRVCKLEPRDTAIVDSGANGLYDIPEAQVSGINPSAPSMRVYTAAAGQLQESTTRYSIPLKVMPADLFANIMPHV